MAVFRFIIIAMKPREMFTRARALFEHLDLFPLTSVVKKLTSRDLAADARASVNVALLTLPMGMAFALMAGLPVQIGIIGCAVAAVAGPIFSGTRFLSFGPSNATAVMLLSALAIAGCETPEARMALLPTIVFLAGIFLLLAAVFRVANFVQYISRTVVTGYITAAAVLIMANQLPNLFGITLRGSNGTFVSVIKCTILQWQEIHPASFVLAAGTLFVYILVKKFLPKLPDMSVALIASCGLMIAINWWDGVLGQGQKVATLEDFGLEQFCFGIPDLSLRTLNAAFSAAMAIAILALIEGTSIGKSVAARAGEHFNTNQEIFGLGMANLFCGLAGGMQASGSLTRSALTFSSGAKTAMSGIFSGLILFAALFGMGSIMHFIPKPALAVLVMFAGTRLINLKGIRLVTTATPGDRAVFFMTLLAGLLAPLDIAIYVGVGLSILLFLRKTSTPGIVEYEYNEAGELAETKKLGETRDPEVSIVHIDGNLYFGSAEIFQDQLRRMLANPNLRVLILKFRNAHYLDATSVILLEELVRSARAAGRSIIICEVRGEAYQVFRSSKLLKVIGRENIFCDHPNNLTLSAALAIRHAYKLLGSAAGTAKVSIFAKDRGKKEES